MKVAIVHDFLAQRGGAERVVLSLHRLFPDAPIYTSIYDPKSTFSEFRQCNVRTSPLQHVFKRGSAGRYLLPLYPSAFRSLTLSGYDLVISSSSAFAHGVRAPGALHVCYCHTPPRFLYQTDVYLSRGGPLSSAAGVAIRPLLAMMRLADKQAAKRPDLYVANSLVTKERIESIYGRQAVVVHPPVEIGNGLVTDDADETCVPSDPFFLAVARLLPYKRVDLAIEATRVIGAKLVVVGQGPAQRELQAMAADHVEFRGAVPQAQLHMLMAKCIALVQPGEEDLGLVALEVNAAGRPVVALARGGALETVSNGCSGILFEEQSAQAVADALERVRRRPFDQRKLRQHAIRFSEESFHSELMAVITAHDRSLSTKVPLVEGTALAPERVRYAPS